MEELQFVDRRHTNSEKWDTPIRQAGRDDIISMSTADMDFRVADSVTNAMRKYVDFGVFGYYNEPESYYDAFIRFEQDLHGDEIRREWIHFAPGCVPAFNWLIRVMTKPGDGILIQSPVYPPFFSSPIQNGRRLVVSELVNDHGRYSVDFDDFERKIAEGGVTCFILCSPHNPVGRVWTREELERMLAICRAHRVLVISDEIHHNILMDGFRHVSALQLPEYRDMVAVLMAPSKTFNLASLQNSLVVIPDEKLRALYRDETSRLHTGGGNALGYIAAEAAYNGGREWLAAVLKTVAENDRYLRARFAAELPKAEISELQGTYLMWINMAAYLDPAQVKDFLNKKCRIYITDGEHFGGDKFRCFLRLNIATSKEMVEKAADAIIRNLPNR